MRHALPDRNVAELVASELPMFAWRGCGGFHFANEMKFSAEGLRSRTKFLSPEFAAVVAGAKDGSDPFTTGSDDFPKAFRVGECREMSPEKTESNVLLFWRSDDRTEQREIKVETVDKNDTWLVNKVSR